MISTDGPSIDTSRAMKRSRSDALPGVSIISRLRDQRRRRTIVNCERTPHGAFQLTAYSQPTSSSACLITDGPACDDEPPPPNALSEREGSPVRLPSRVASSKPLIVAERPRPVIVLGGAGAALSSSTGGLGGGPGMPKARPSPKRGVAFSPAAAASRAARIAIARCAASTATAFAFSLASAATSAALAAPSPFSPFSRTISLDETIHSDWGDQRQPSCGSMASSEEYFTSIFSSAHPPW